jgi:S-adenosylmethionine/arginine decarboxylase-like enzyme
MDKTSKIQGRKNKTRKIQSSKNITGKNPSGNWGYHLIVDAGDCNPDSLRSKSTIAKFAKELVSKIDMTAYGEPQIVMFGSGHVKGFTLVQLIETSDITCHFAEETNDAYFDVFSCKIFDPTVALKVFQTYFQPTKIQKKFFTRQAPSHT